MRVVLQRVSRGQVTVDGKVAGKIGSGLVVLAGVAESDEAEDLELIADKATKLRIFPDEEGKMNVSARDANAEMLVVSQFTLYADCRKGRRPSFIHAAPPDKASEMVDRFVEMLRDRGMIVETGVFGATMDVELVNAGPVTIVLDSDELKKPRN